MKTRKTLAVLLIICLILASLSVAAFAEGTSPIVLGETVTFDITEQTHVVYYRFTPETDGTYVLYDVSGGHFLSTLSVHTVAPEEDGFDESLISCGPSRASFEATAGTTYWFKLDCWYATNEAVSYSFTLATPVEAVQIQLDANKITGFVGDGGEVQVLYTPLNATGELTWASSDPTVVTVSGDDCNAAYRFVGAGTATITATTSNGVSDSFQVTVNGKETMEVGTDKTVTIPSGGGEFQTVEQTYYFTASAAGYYALSVSYIEGEHSCHSLQMTVRTRAGSVYGTRSLIFSAEAGEECQIDVEFWGACEKDVDYTLAVQPCIPGESLRLKADTDAGYVGSILNIQAVWKPVNSWPEELTWTSSDPTIAQIKSYGLEHAKLELLAPGVVTVTATNAGGLRATVKITVLEIPGIIGLTLNGADPVILPADSAVNVSFAPAQSGYYQLQADHKDLTVGLNASSIIDGGRKLYYLEAGKSYTGFVENCGSGLISGKISVTQEELLSIAGLTISKQPSTTTYLKSELEDLWTYQILAGMEMEVTWSDGSKTAWRFDAEGPYIGNEQLQWSLDECGPPGKRQLTVRCGEGTASCLLTVLDTTVVGIELVDKSPLQNVKNSCGFMDGDSWHYTPYLAYLRDVKIRFSDGSSVTARAEDTVYGSKLLCVDRQFAQAWGTGGNDRVTFSYQGFSVDLKVQIVESKVERIELLQIPKNTFEFGDRTYFSGGRDLYFFRNEKIGAFADGLSFKIWYKDGTAKTVKASDVERIRVMGISYPFVDGYPVGLESDLAAGLPVTGMGDHQGMIEYMGAVATYTIHIVEPKEPLPSAGDEPIAYLVVLALLCCAALPVCKKRFF